MFRFYWGVICLFVHLCIGSDFTCSYKYEGILSTSDSLDIVPTVYLSTPYFMALMVCQTNEFDSQVYSLTRQTNKTL